MASAARKAVESSGKETTEEVQTEPPTDQPPPSKEASNADLEKLQGEARRERGQRNQRAGAWKVLHYLLLFLVLGYGAIAGGVTLTNAGVSKETAGLLLLIGAVLGAVGKGFDALARTTANVLSRNEWDAIEEQAGDAREIDRLTDEQRRDEVLRLRRWKKDRSDRDAQSRMGG